MLILRLPPDLSSLWETVPELPQAQRIPSSLYSTALAILALTAIQDGSGFLLGSGCVCISIGQYGAWHMVGEA